MSALKGLWTPILIMAGVAGFLALTYQLPVESRAMPLGVGWTTLALAFVDLLSRTRTGFGEALMKTLNPAGDEDVAAERSDAAWTRQATGVLLPVLFTAALVLFGILIGAALFVFAAIFLSDRRRWLEAIALTVGATAFVWLVFAVVLKLQLFSGLLFGASL
jgi:hypothetical protein